MPNLTGEGSERTHPWHLLEKAKSIDYASFAQKVDISCDVETGQQVILGAWVMAALQLRLEYPVGTRAAGLDV